MDSRVWSMLPEDLTDRVLAWFSYPSLIQARTVCKRWNSTIFSPSFLDMHSDILCRNSFFLLFPSIGDLLVCSAYNPETQNWQIMPPMSFLPPEVKFVEGAAGGLLFFSIGVQFQPVKLFVCNPLTSTCRQLPEMKHKRTPIVRHMIVDKNSEAYKIVVAGNAEFISHSGCYNRFLNTEVYDSVSGLWRETGDIPPRFDPNWSSAYCNGILYCMVNETETVNQSLGVITYDLKQGSWSNDLEHLPEGFSLAQVVECGDQILLVAERYWNGNVKNIHLLRLDFSTRQWTEISRLPRKMLLEFRKICNEESYSCVASETQVYLSSFKGYQVLVFSVTHGSWGWLPKCPFFGDQLDYSAVGFSYSPSVRALM